jgi:hypothetical protein
VVTRGSSGLFNDFYDYWAAALLLNRGHNPYDIAALHAVQQAAGLQSETGTGYSYPLFFAELIRPFALLPAPDAAFVFTVISVIALVFAIAFLLGSLPDLRWPVALAGGAAAGLFPPVIGSLYFGQANLVVLLLLTVSYRCVMPGPLLGIAGAIKLYPAAGLLAALIHRRWRVLRNGLAILAVLLLIQLLNAGGGFGAAGSLLTSDTYWSNESINGWLSRLAIASTWTKPPYPGLPVEPIMLGIVAVLTILTVVVLLRAPLPAWEGALALSLWLGVVCAPKNSLWNFTPLLICVAYGWSQLGGRWHLFAVGLVGWLLIELQAQLDSARETVYQGGAALAWLSSVGLYGGLILGALTAYLVLRPATPYPRRSLPPPSQ